MSLPMKKAGESLARRARFASVRTLATTPPGPPPTGPQKSKSSDTTMMPWNGWFSSFLEAKLGPKNYARLEKAVIWKPEDKYGLMQVPTPDHKVPISKDDPTKVAMFRYPSPGSQPAPQMPQGEEGTRSDDPYDNAYYPEDTRRRYDDRADPNPILQQMKLDMLDPDDPRVESLKKELEEGPKSSPGNKGVFATGKSDFDPTGLRATMSANHVALNEELDRNMPDHLPTPEWYERQDEIIAWFEDKDHPLPLGGTGSNYMKTERRIARW